MVEIKFMNRCPPPLSVYLDFRSEVMLYQRWKELANRHRFYLFLGLWEDEEVM